MVTIRWSRTFVIGWTPFAVAALTASLMVGGGCSSSSTHSSAPKCGTSPACAVGSACIGGGSDAGPSCQKLCTQQSDCPFNSYCNDGQPQSWCVQSTLPVPQASGQFGDFCAPSGGENNPACDTADTFGCYGISPTDANAFCTILDCQADSDCKGGWWCATIDVAPNVSSVKRSFGKSRTACLPRSYCASCKSDHDCNVAPDGTLEHCVPDSAGGSFCSNKCGSDANCPLDAVCRAPWALCAQRTCKNDGDCQQYVQNEGCFNGTCQFPCQRDSDCPATNGSPQHCGDNGACIPQSCKNDDDCPPTAGTFQHCNGGTCTPECGSDSDCSPDFGDQTCTQPLKVCTPRAGVCVGDGTFCSPCRADADCHNGYCLAAPYSTERFCSQTMKPGTSCASTGPPSGSCPARPSNANYKGVACTQSASDMFPANQCIGFVTFGTDNSGQPLINPGCWTVNR